MKALYSFILLLVSAAAQAQSPTTPVFNGNSTAYEWWNNQRFHKLRLPLDTLNTENGSIGWKNGVLYGKWNGRFNPITGAGSSIDTSYLSNRINHKLNWSDTSLMLAPYRTRFNNYLLLGDTASMLAPYLRADRLGALNAITLPVGGFKGQVLKKSSDNDYDVTWANDNAGEGTGTGASYSRYTEPFIGTASAQFTISKTPVSGRIDVFVNGIRIPRSAFTLTVNTVLINSAALGYPIAATDQIEIIYESPL